MPVLLEWLDEREIGTEEVLGSIMAVYTCLASFTQRPEGLLSHFSELIRRCSPLSFPPPPLSKSWTAAASPSGMGGFHRVHANTRSTVQGSVTALVTVCIQTSRTDSWSWEEKYCKMFLKLDLHAATSSDHGDACLYKNSCMGCPVEGGNSSCHCLYWGIKASYKPLPQHQASLLLALGIGSTSGLATAFPRSLSCQSQVEFTCTRASFTWVSCTTVFTPTWDIRENRKREKASSGVLGMYKTDSIWRGQLKETSPKTWAYLKLLEVANGSRSISDFSYLSEMLSFVSFLPTIQAGEGKEGLALIVLQTQKPDRSPHRRKRLQWWVHGPAVAVLLLRNLFFCMQQIRIMKANASYSRAGKAVVD